MLKRVVVIKFKKDVPESEIAGIEKGLAGLPGAIPEIAGDFRFGRDVLRSERSYDFALVTEFENIEAIQRYRSHPAHQEVLKKLLEHCDSIITADFEI
ncbi:MAG TPA: Dabb family protein [Nitrospirota bacterium]|nr:Dabb family protein [Nitrospirota bacterium]